MDLQNELVELARKNEQAEKQCAALWRELERGAQRPPRNGRLAARLARLRRRLLTDLLDRVNVPRTRDPLMRQSPE